jgi:hypothetical protein
MKPTEFRSKMSKIAHPQGQQRYEVSFGKRLEANPILPESQPTSDVPLFQPTPRESIDRRVKDPAKRDFLLVGGCSPGSYTLTSTADHSVDPASEITLSPEGGIYASGTIVTVTANTSDENTYCFDVWTGNVPAGHETDNPLTITMDSNKTLTATFKLV